MTTSVNYYFDPNHGYFHLLPIAEPVPDTPAQSGCEVFGDYGGLPLYTTQQPLTVHYYPGEQPTDQIVPGGSTVQIIGHYCNNRGDQWFEIGYHQWVVYMLEDKPFGFVERYEVTV